ncbi:MdtA/MuxA family multidrug efflux RND transporter periplasmic adaptor subunit [Lichenicola cladoniae]|uniref:MdtA/MuxA family multidrug efflux RND transporter periplasmic adaptor subunit n=1 Tax=Lichenicola cladoniae TaxID=1484109 RepID=A0A6M8HMP2_9PROT|nr:MdtA/MuxA family multidrug efflux RND transporter periplasmic adaptor subunit [Lichenicola cladoniae]NPD67013.1 MdtA/MuxA family multidrug efflux RND transporter periplasmic adaptor subunit [Acetobacteraceae bacterium]QKE89561.1 MdtA/MuxA family multidrug efflux RND transporter periplasmic adaptor subunit [Lichenicola cladoniae]
MDEPTRIPDRDTRVADAHTAASPAPLPPSGPAATSRRRRRWLPWLIVLLVVGVIAYALLRPQTKPAATGGRHHRGAAGQNADGTAQAQPVSEAVARTGDMPVVLTQLGTVTSLATITVQSQISGYLLEVNFTEGQEVHKGDQLALVDPRLYIATLTQYEGNLIRDTALLKQAQADYARYQLLLRQKSIASQLAENQIFVVGQYQGAIRTDEGQIASAKQNIAYCHILSPIDGRVGLRQVDAGNYITSSATNGLVVVTQVHPISVIFTIPEDNIPSLQAQMKAGTKLEVDAYDRTNTLKLASGFVQTIDNTIDTSTGTVRIRSIFTNTDDALFPNQFVNARLLLQTLHNAVLIPNGAIQTGPQGNFVYLVQADNTVAVRPIKTGTASMTDTVITSGLAVGDKVVTDGTDKLKTGSKVMVPPPAPAKAPAAAGTPAHHRHGGDQ